MMNGELIASRLLEIDGRRHRVFLAGTGAPPVVFEPAIGDVGLTWALVQAEVARTTSTFTHDRPGLGGSDPSALPRTVNVMVNELRTALGTADIAPPYVLVGHSFSSLTVQAFAHLHPESVRGIVLVDGAHEDQMERFPPELTPRAMLASFAEQLRQLAEAGRRGEALPELISIPQAFPEALAGAYREATSPTPDRLETAAAEYDDLLESQQQVRALSGSSLGDIPIIALRHGVPQSMTNMSDEVNQRYEAAWQQMQDELAGRSNSGQVVVAEGAGHMIHHDRPELVAEAIRNLLR